MSEPQSAAIATIDPTPAVPMYDSIPALFGGAPDAVEFTTFDLTKMEDSVGYLLSIGGESQTAKQLVNETIEVCHYTVRLVTLTSAEDGEIITTPRIVLVGPDGQCISSTSPSVIRMIAAVGRTAVGKPPWNPPMKFKLKITQTANKRDCLQLIPILTVALGNSAKQKRS